MHLRRPWSTPRIALVASYALCFATCSGDDKALTEAALHMTAAMTHAPFSMPDTKLTAADGRSFNLRRDTRGAFVLLFFGYSSCPDVCPMTLAVMNAALAGLADDERTRVMGLFVTVDPWRDDPSRLSAWLTGMRSPVVGLTAPPAELEPVLAHFSVPLPPTPELVAGGGPARDYAVAHPASIWLVTPDGVGRFVYVFGATPGEIDADLRRLFGVRFGVP